MKLIKRLFAPLRHAICWIGGGHSEAEVFDDFRGTATMECFGCKRRRKVKYDCPQPSSKCDHKSISKQLSNRTAVCDDCGLSVPLDTSPERNEA